MTAAHNARIMKALLSLTQEEDIDEAGLTAEGVAGELEGVANTKESLPLNLPQTMVWPKSLGVSSMQTSQRSSGNGPGVSSLR